MEERIHSISYEGEMQQSFLDYAMTVIKDRALPDVRDGLKPVHRRILYAMYEMGMTPEKAHKKSARIVGEVLGKFHPHGDSSVYDAMVRMAQDFNMNSLLIEGHGNFGSIDGDPAAAMRYTEARLSEVALAVLGDIDKGVVPYGQNFDETLKEPLVLGSRYPNLLVNGTSGIAVGMATSIPSHNLTEVVKALIRFIDNPNLTVKQLMQTLKGPDFPTGGTVINKDDLLSIYETGIGKLLIRAKLETESLSHGRTNIVVTEIPQTFSGSKTRLLEKIIDMARDKKLDEITDVRDESDKDGIRIVLEVKRGVNIENFIQKLYKKTPLEDTMGVEFIALVNNRPEVLNLKQLFHHYLEFQKEITLRKYEFLLNKAKNREEILSGLLIATDVIDVIIEAIRGSKDVDSVKRCLIEGDTSSIAFKTKKAEKQAKTFGFTERQAQAILDMKLQRLIQLEIHKLEDELTSLKKSIRLYQNVLKKEKVLLEIIKEDLLDMAKQFGWKRRTVIEQVDEKEYVEEIAEEELKILIDRFGYIKSVDMGQLKRLPADGLKDYSYTLDVLNTAKIGVFTDKGSYHQIKAIDIPKTKLKEKGIPIENVSKMDKERIVLLENHEDIIANQLILATTTGMVKLMDGKELKTSRLTVQATKLDEVEELASVGVLKEEAEHVILRTKNEKAIKFSAKDIPLQKRNSKGVIGISLEKGELVIELITLNKNEKRTEEWGNKEIALQSIRSRKRGSKGISL